MGPTSHTGPKTLRAARDRPELNPRENRTSRHEIAGAAAGRRPPHEKLHTAAQQGARNTTATLRARIARPARNQRSKRAAASTITSRPRA
ncbi:heat stress transcription factor A-4b-like [Dorcoceras hygrometricum]|uniref:Heat stress transcription factor A-4b-like n=1 Tax=Dorcoceras hygrometricum TaxID=472368 RepID=A0A2Z6ZX26_9LAMI|nr:heat stress transcription factor A-4b-like [Dorcoceras hygrometricum]